MRPSIRTFLLINLLLGVLLVSSLAIVGNLFFSRKDIRSELDRTLASTSLRIQSFIQQFDDKQAFLRQQRTMQAQSEALLSTKDHAPESIVFQFWDADGQLLLRSRGAPKAPLSTGKLDFSTHKINDHTWRVHTTYLPKHRGMLMVAESFAFETHLENQLTRDSTLIMLLIYPFLGLLIWVIVGRGLKPLKQITTEIEHRAPSHLHPVAHDSVPKEIHPLISALNHLFARLQDAFDREKRFTADAAHELRTPLAAIKAHAEVALSARSAEELEQTLKKVSASVTRSTHVVQQLLTLNRMVPEASINDPVRMNLETEVAEMAAQIVPSALEKDIEIELHSEGSRKPFIHGNPTAIAILARNLIDNAVRYSPAGKRVKLIIESTDKQVTFKVIDNGPGIPQELRERVFERFYRTLGSETVGSGLGLSIVQQIVKLHGATLQLDTAPSGQGCQFSVSFQRID